LIRNNVRVSALLRLPGLPGPQRKTSSSACWTPGNAGMQPTSGYAMLPAASVCGYYFSHPRAEYFVLGQILPDQLEDYARRKDCSIEEVRRLLPANLAD
jgi:5-methyltetrahydrofolate--homocysteine methyltransferase